MATDREATAKHTPGPWTIKPPVTGQHSPTIHAENRDCVATVWTRASTANIDEPRDLPSEANAALIAAAPELLAFAKAFRDMADTVTARGVNARPTVAQLNALLEQSLSAIAKATA